MHSFLKLVPPGEAADNEAEALRAFAGRGAVRLLEYDPAAASLLLERAEPGHALALLDDERAMDIAASVLETLVRPATEDVHLPPIEHWLAALDHASDAYAVATELLAPSPRYVLHGDLHQFNILAAGDSWLAIDPKGVIGERECELGPLILNPIDLLARSDIATLTDRRMGQLCERLGFDRKRAYAWTFVRVELAIAWAIEDDGHAPAEWIACARHLRGAF